jgi:hypothetical protein
MRKLFTLIIVCTSTVTWSQELTLIEGDLKPLKGQTAIKITFTYNDMVVGENLAETEYVSKRKEELELKQKGQGEKWALAWVEDRKWKFEPDFRMGFSKASKMSTMEKAPMYTLTFHTSYTEPGWTSGVAFVKKSALIEGEALITETANPAAVIARIKVAKVPGTTMSAYDFETGQRITAAYETAGREIALFIKSKSKK